jgi:transposase
MDRQRLAETERRMVTVLDELELTTLVTSIHGISAVGAAAILAETGDPHRFATARAMVKHAGLAPREKLSGNFTGRTKLTGQGRPRLRVAAWRAVWGSLQTNTVYAIRYRHLTTREHNKLKPTQAQTVIAATILHTCTPWSPPAKPGTPRSQPTEPRSTRHWQPDHQAATTS